MNSLRSPASACAIVGFRPTKGQISRQGIVPVTETQDVAGPMGRSVDDVRILFNAMRSKGEPENVKVSTARPSLEPPQIRIGMLEDYLGDDSTAEGKTVNTVIHQALSSIQSRATVEVVLIPRNPNWDVPLLREEADMQAYEFRTLIDAFLQSPTVQTPHTSLASIAASGEYNQDAMTAVFEKTLQGGESTPTSAEYRRRLERIELLTESVNRCFAEHGLTALVYPHQRQLVAPVGYKAQPGRNGILAALTGRPAICIPAGFSPKTPSAPQGIPIGIEIMGQPWHDEEILNLAETFETILSARKPPISTNHVHTT